MKKNKIVSTALTEEEYEQFREAWMDAENMAGERITVSKFLRDTILASLNNSVPDSDQEIVSSEPTHTDSKQKNNDAPWNDLEFN